MPRKSKNLPVKDRFIIITNGRCSEKNYFESIRTHFLSLYKISVKFKNADPVGLVNYAIGVKESNNIVWCVFDKDYFPSDSINRALQKAMQNDIGIAFSNAAFEVWLINHFRMFDAEKNPDELLDIVTNELAKEGYSGTYEKNDKTVIDQVFMKRIRNACDNADVVYQRRLSEYKADNQDKATYIKYCEWNSFTTVHKLIDALKIRWSEE